MKRKFIKILALAISFSLCLFMFSGCERPQTGHVHDFNEVAQEQFLKAEATCSSPALYYKSCDCGEKSTEYFSSGLEASHVFDQKVEGERYVFVALSCTQKAVYYLSCTCGECSFSEELTFEGAEEPDHFYEDGVCTVCGEPEDDLGE